MSSPSYVRPPRLNVYTDADSYREMREIMSVMRGVTGTVIRLENGQYSIRYTENAYISYTRLKQMVDEAKAQAKKNMKIVDAHIAKAKREINAAKQSALVDASKYERMYDEEIARLKKLRDKAKEDIVSDYGNFNCSKDVKAIDNQIEELRKHRNNIQNERQDFLKALDRYEKAIDDIVIADDIRRAESKRPEMSFSVKTHLENARSLHDKIEDKIERGKKFASEMNKVASIIRGGKLEKYDVRFVEKMKTIDPFAEDAIDQIENLLNIVYEDEKYLEAQLKSEQMSKDAEKQAEEDLKVLREIASDLKAVIVNAHEEEKVADSSDKNEKLLEEVNNLISKIRNLDYVSPQIQDKIKKCELDLEDQKSNIKSSRFTLTATTYIDELTKLFNEAVDDNESYQEFMDELEEYNEIMAILDPEEYEEDIDMYGQAIFDVKNAKQQVQDLKEANKKLRTIFNEITSRTYIQSAVSVLENGKESRVFKKEMNDEEMSVSFISKDHMGVMYEMRTEEGQCALFAKGVILHNGKKLADVNKLKTEGKTCRWHEELEDEMVAVGLPRFGHVNRSDEYIEAYYANEDECYIKLNSYEESYRYLKLFNLSDEEIKNILGEEDSAPSKQAEQQKQTQQQAAQKYKENKEGQ